MKIRFSSMQEAERYAASRGNPLVEAYHCSRCDGFHVGKRRGML